MANPQKIRLGTAPDSWGVWFPADRRQLPWHRFLDEAAEAGYEWIELGPYGYLPTDPAQLRDELGARGLRLSGGAVVCGLHRGADALATAFEEFRQVSRLLTALDARYLIPLPEMYTDIDGRLIGPKTLTSAEWQSLTTGTSLLGRMLREEFDVGLVFHPHADSHVGTIGEIDRFLQGTDPACVGLCLDTGHIAYCGGDPTAIIQSAPDRIGYVHLKQVNPDVHSRAVEAGLSFAEAAALGVMIEPPLGVPQMEPLLDQLGALDVPLFAIVEQDMYPCHPDAPLPIAARTHRYYTSRGLGQRGE
jgi:inosose dehydratase